MRLPSPSPDTSLRPLLRILPSRSLSGVLLGALLLTLLTTGCATRLNRHPIVKKRTVVIDLVTVKEGIFKTQQRDFEHPAIISFDRMKNILNAIEVETAEEGNLFLRQPAIHPDILDDAAAGMVEAFGESDPNSELGVKLIRKEGKLGVFHTKYLTSFLAHIKEGHLYIVFSQIDWPIPQSKETGRLPEPQPGGSNAKFRIVSGEPLFYAGPQALEIAWRSNLFRKPYRLPGSTKGEKRRRELLFQSEIPAEELEGAGGGGSGVGDLSPEALRALADLEEDRRAGRITETAYQRAKRELLRKR